MNYQQQGITFALENIKAGKTAGHAHGTAWDSIGREIGPAKWDAEQDFLAGVRLISELSCGQQLAARHLLNGSASMTDAAQLPREIVAALRTMEPNFDYIASLVDSGVAAISLPPYES